MERARIKKGSSKASSPVLGASYSLAQNFSIGRVQLRFYSMFFVLAIVVGYILGHYRARREEIDTATIDDIFFWLVVNSFLAARAYYVIFYFSLYKKDLAEIIRIWHGGLAIYGALIGGVLTLWYFSRSKAISFLKLTDIVTFGLPLAQAVGRFGNYFNYEAFGNPTNLPWKMFVPLQFRPDGYQQYSFFHPTFFYEAIWDVLLFGVLALIFRFSRKNPGKIPVGLSTAVYLLLYSIGRFVIEGIRLDSAYFGPFRGDQLTSLFMIVFALVIIKRVYATQTD